MIGKLQRGIWLLAWLFCLSACQGPGISPEQRLETAEAEAVAQHIATLGSIAATNTAIHLPTAAITFTPQRPLAEAPTLSPTIAPTRMPSETPSPDPFPTPVILSIYIAEQEFERGWMFWLRPTRQIWLLREDEGRRSWVVYDDTFVDGEAESDPAIIPPADLQQPTRGFGKLWRENATVRQALGWALSDEIGHTTRYEYRQGGALSSDSAYAPGPGWHLLRAYNGYTFRFNESDFSWSSSA